MNRLPITQLQRNIGDISLRLIRGEEIILTRNGKDFARLVPVAPALPKPRKRLEYPPMPRLPRAEAIKEAESIIAEVKGKPTPTDTVHGRCEAPFANCKFIGDLYEIEFYSDGEIKKGKKYLCPGHAKKAREGVESMRKL